MGNTPRQDFDDVLGRIAALPTTAGTLYVPRVRGGQLWVDVSERPLVIPPRVRLELAPGVVLVPLVRSGTAGATAVLEVAGTFQAPLGTVFATRGWFERRGGADPARVGTVRFTSRAMDRVHPEWWGAGDASDATRPGDDDDALDAALRAALHDRTSGGRWLRPLVIELLGTYRLSHPWSLRRGAHPGAGLSLRGAPGAAGAATFVCGLGFPADEAAGALAMVDAQGFEGASFEDLRFEGNDAVGACLRLDSARSSLQTRGHLVRRCGFARARRLVGVTATGAGATGGGPLGVPLDDVRFEHCVFHPSTKAGGALPVGLHVTAVDAGVEVRGCRFEGAAAAMIHAVGGALAVTSCQFETRVPFEVSTREEDLHAGGPEGDLDIFLDRAGGGPVASVYAQDCFTRSEQFLATVRADDAPACGDSTIVSLRHVRPTAPRRENDLFTVPPPKRLPPIWVVFEPTPLASAVAPSPLDAPKAAAPPRTEKGHVSLDAKAAAAPKGAVAPWGEKLEVAPAQRFEQPQSGAFVLPPGALDVGKGATQFQAAGRGVAPIYWRVPSATGARLLLVGCRFARLRGLPAVRALGRHAPVADIGILGGTPTISANVSAALLDVPLLPPTR